MKKNKTIGAMLILAAFLMGSGCKQPQQEAPGATPAPEAPKVNPKPSDPVVVQETIQFEGVIEKNIVGDTENKAKVPYFVTVSLSHNKVGATAETVESGILYIGKSSYDAKSGAIDISLADARGIEEAITLTATYENATKSLIITEFAGMTEKAVLTRVTKPGEGVIKRYNTMVNLSDPIGEAFLSLIVKDQHVTAILVAGQIKEDGTTGRARTYNASGYVRRGEVLVEIPLDHAKTHVVAVTGRLSSSGVVQGVTASLMGSVRETHEEHHGQNAQYATLPLFKPVKFTINSKQKVTEGAGPHGTNINKKAYLTLRAVPIVKALGQTNVGDAGDNVNGYKTFGYRMYAQFIGFDGTKSNLVHVDVHCLDANGAPLTGTASINGYTPNTKTYEFTFEDTGASNRFGNGAGFDNTNSAYAFTITGWRPEDVKKADGTVEHAKTVTTGDYEISFGANTKALPGVSGTELKNLFGSKSSIVAGQEAQGYQYKKLDAASTKANEFFAKTEQFQEVYANRPSYN